MGKGIVLSRYRSHPDQEEGLEDMCDLGAGRANAVVSGDAWLAVPGRDVCAC